MKALGAPLIQEGKPVAFASKALTDEETRHANIERELLAVVYGCERFHTYLYGQAFTVESDHKPLKSIHLKHLKAAPPRLQRMLLRLQPYDLTIEYKPGKEMALADALSRLTSSEDPPIKGLNVKVHQVFTQFSDSCLLRIKDATSTDSELNALKETIYNGWPEKLQDTPLLCRPYWNFRDEICMEDGILMKSSRIIIPKAMRPEILKTLHQPHMGIEKTKLRAREAVSWKIPKHQSTSQKVTTLTKLIFSEHGIPSIVRSDNGPHFSGTAYKEFTKTYGFKHETSSPHYPKSNGFIESQVKIVRKTLKKAMESSQDPYLSLLALRTTPLSNNLPAPGELLYNRPLQDKLPKKIFRPSNCHTIQPALLQRQESKKTLQ
ncbi:retrotransposable element Tf2 155 kDa protein type 1 [Elysia marginata]|uniref:Retrotransposable element Tf2 155 kDa protein type 1 n=1 Tax=Elysia marginata TaxID=1093978 RepID=A0AAV4FDA0_9GAST|nr:retrotransposable element Tf2 155 kDa protein type 1 [Elysia marginata]